RLIFEVVPDPSARLAALRAGDLDIIQGVTADQVPIIEQDENVELKPARGTTLTYLAFNTTKAPFDDPAVRRALAYAIDYDLLVSHVYGGRAEPLYGLSTSWNNEFQYPDQVPYHYDPEMAQELLEQAGVTDLEIVIDTVADFALMAEAIAQMLRDIGIDAQSRVWEQGALSAAVESRDRQATVHDWGNGSGSPIWPTAPNQAGRGYTHWEHEE